MTIFWFRRDLRLHDNAGLYHALKKSKDVLPLFIFDKEILHKLDNKADARVIFIHQTIQELKEELSQLQSSIIVQYGNPKKVWADLLQEYDIDAVYCNHDFESYAIERDNAVEKLLTRKMIPFYHFKDHVIFEKKEVTKKDGDPYTVFTPYSRVWKAKLESKIWKVEGKQQSFYLTAYPTEKYFDSLKKSESLAIPSLESMGFTASNARFPNKTVNRGLIKNYAEMRDFPAIEGTSRLGLHFRFGTISVREKARNSQKLSETYLNELIWRDFYAQILANFPHVELSAFRAKYERVEWRNNEDEFEAWCAGKTGYPLVDAGMRELNQSGFMHNRVRMVVASFLTKHLLIDWRWGEAYFAEKLLDYDLASNNGGWQWAAGCGTDAAPYFRIFNPESQQKKFDKDFTYIKKWVPEYGTDEYCTPIVEHKAARQRCLETYKKALT